MTFLANPPGLSPAAFKSYVAACRWPVWKPKFIVLHNTAEPNLKQWAHGNDGKDHEYHRILNLNLYYKGLGWHSGPHLFISPNLIWVACDLAADGVHASCYNSESLGVEMVGDYSDEAFDRGDGAKVRDLTVQALAILHHALKIDPDSLRFHKECLHDHHDCPGKHVDKADMIARIRAAMAAAPVAAPKPPALAAHVEAV
jgi:N-acetylmuramoyl-L-alanine amidase